MKIHDEKLTSTVRTKAVAEGDSGEGEEEEDEEDEEDCCDPSPPPKVRCNLSSVAKISRRITSSFSRKALVHSRCWSAIFFSNNRLFFNSCGNEKIFQSVVLQKGLQIGQKHWVDEKTLTRCAMSDSALNRPFNVSAWLSRVETCLLRAASRSRLSCTSALASRIAFVIAANCSFECLAPSSFFLVMVSPVCTIEPLNN